MKTSFLFIICSRKVDCGWGITKTKIKAILNFDDSANMSDWTHSMPTLSLLDHKYSHSHFVCWN